MSTQANGLVVDNNCKLLYGFINSRQKTKMRIYDLNNNKFEPDFDFQNLNPPSTTTPNFQMEMLKNGQMEKNRIFASDVEAQKLFILDQQGLSKTLHEFNMKTKKLSTLCTQTQSGYFHQLIVVNNDIHLFGVDCEHFIFNVKSKDFQEIPLEMQYIEDVIYLPSKKCILAFNEESFARFDLEQKKWIQSLRFTVPFNRVHSTVTVKTHDDQYLIIIGTESESETKTKGYFDHIYIVDTNYYTFKRCSLCCPPFKDIDNALAFVQNNTNSEMLAVGYWRKNYDEASTQRIAPEYITKLCAKWLQDDCIHLLTNNEKEHYMIGISDIIA